MINRLFKVAIIGAGIGKEHLNAFNTQLDRFSVKYICDLDVDKAKRLISNNNTKITEDYEEVLNDDEIDLIDICLPPDLHFEYVKKNSGLFSLNLITSHTHTHLQKFSFPFYLHSLPFYLNNHNCSDHMVDNRKAFTKL